MTKSILKVGLLSLVAGGVLLIPALVQGQEKEKSTAEKKQPAHAKQTTGPFHGKLAAVDKSAKSITVGKRTFYITSETKINKAGKPATLDDGVVGEEASGGFKTADDGKLVVTKLN